MRPQKKGSPPLENNIIIIVVFFVLVCLFVCPDVVVVGVGRRVGCNYSDGQKKTKLNRLLYICINIKYNVASVYIIIF